MALRGGHLERSPGAGAMTSGPRSAGALRTAALVALLIGAAVSVVLLLQSGRRNASILLVVVGLTIWVLSPFVILRWANLVSKRWSSGTQTTLACLALLVTLGSLAIYGNLITLRPSGTANAFRFVIVAPVSWLLIALVVVLAARVLRRGRRRG